MADRSTAKGLRALRLPNLGGLWARARISHKIGAIGIVGITGLVLISAIYIAGSSAQDAFTRSGNEARDIHSQVTKVLAKILDARGVERDFLLQPDEQQIKRHKELSKEILADFEVLRRLIQASEHADLESTVELARAGITSYAGRFDTLAQRRVKLGLSENLGLEGTLRKSVHEIETKLKEFDHPQLSITMLMMRRHEKDFMLRKNIRYGAEIKKRSEEFAKTLAATDVPDAAKADITKKLADYQRDFSIWMNEAVAIGEEQRSMSDDYSAVEPSIQILKDAVEKAYQRARTDIAQSQVTTSLWLHISIVLVILGVGTLSWLIGRAISKPLSALGGVMRQLSAGDNTVDVPSLGRQDEIGDMAKAVQTFKEAAIEKLQLEGMTAQQRKAAEEERRRNEEIQKKAAEEQAEVVRHVATGLTRLSDGDLTFRVEAAFPPAYQQLKDDFNAAMEQLHATMTTIVQAAQGMKTNTGELSNATDDLSKRTETQAANLEETAAAVEEITATVRKTADGASHANEMVSKAKGDAERSGEVVRKAVDAMGAIEGSAKQISQIIGVIDEIAFQTNLLALNAGVEAARAGDAGRGFAVVASEVRSLAQRSAEAAKEIKSLISASTAQVDGGAKLVKQTGEVLVQIVTQVAAINEVVTEIAASAKEQATGLGQVNTAVNQMDQVTQQNAALVEESTAASRALATEAQKLADLVAQFNVDGQHAAPAPRANVEKLPVMPRARFAARTGTDGRLAQNAQSAAEQSWQEF